MSATTPVIIQVLHSHVSYSRTDLRRDADTRGGDCGLLPIRIFGEDRDRNATSKRAAELSGTIEIRD
jgi:hypothetical protein